MNNDNNEKNVQSQAGGGSVHMASDKYKALFMSSRDAVMTLEPPSWKFTAANPATVAMFGAKDEQDFLRYPPWELSPKLQADGSNSMGKAMEMIDEAMQKGSNLFEWTHKRINGEDFPAEVLLSKVEEGGKAYLHAVVRDMTERKKMQTQVVEAAQEKFRIFFENANDGMLLADRNTANFILGNKAICDMLGYTSEEVVKLSLKDIHPADSLSFVLDQFEKQARGEIKIAKDLPVKRKDGSVFYADINASNVKIGDHEYMLGMFRDITERKLLEEKILETKDTYEGILNSINETIYVQDEHGAFIYVNKAAQTMYGYETAEFIGRTPEFLSAKGKNNLSEIAALVKKAYDGEPQRFEFWGLKKDGTIFPKEVSVTPGMYFGKKCVIAVARDISEAKKQEEAIKAKIKEVEDMNRFMVGRELKMTDLKKEIEVLKSKLK